MLASSVTAEVLRRARADGAAELVEKPKVIGTHRYKKRNS